MWPVGLMSTWELSATSSGLCPPDLYTQNATKLKSILTTNHQIYEKNSAKSNTSTGNVVQIKSSDTQGE